MQLSILIADTDEPSIDVLVRLLSAANAKIIVNITTLPSEVASLLSASVLDITFLNVDTCNEDLLRLDYDAVPVVVTGNFSAPLSPSTQAYTRTLSLDEYSYHYASVKDFLPGPFDQKRLAMVLEHLRNFLAKRELERWQDEQLLSAIAKIEGITATAADNAAVPDDASILYCEANRNYTTVYRLSSEGQLEKETLSRSIGMLEKEWSPESFSASKHPFLVRIHHSAIVNSRFVAEVRRHENRKDYIVRLMRIKS